MDTTVPSVKSLLVRARVSLAEAAEARLLTCEEVRLELGQVAEGLVRTSPPVRRHLRTCERCTLFRRELRNTSRALAAVYPIGMLVVVKKFVLAKLGAMGGAAGRRRRGRRRRRRGGDRRRGGCRRRARRGQRGHRRRHDLRGHRHRRHQGRGRAAAAAIVTAGAVEVKQAHRHPVVPVSHAKVAVVAQPVPQVVSSQPQPTAAERARHRLAKAKHDASATKPVVDTTVATPAEPVTGQPQVGTTDQGGSTVTLPQQPGQTPEGATDADPTATGVAPAPAPIVTPAPPATSSDPAVVGPTGSQGVGTTGPDGGTTGPADDPDSAPPPDDGDTSSTQDPPPPAG